MPIGVPRIIYSWGEELPAQWTDIYNFIFRRRMVFLMQYLDDELCNQICGLLINIHMEDRSKELEKNEMEGDTKASSTRRNKITESPSNFSSKKKSGSTVEDLLNSDEDLGIDDINTLEQLTLQKITKEWLNWNSQFFDYSDEPYLYYLAQTLTKDFGNGQNKGNAPYNLSAPQFFNTIVNNIESTPHKTANGKGKGLDVYSAFRNSTQFTNEKDYSLKQMHPFLNGNPTQGSIKKNQLLQMFSQGSSTSPLLQSKNVGLTKLLTDLAGQDFSRKIDNPNVYKNISEKALGQRHLRREYKTNTITSSLQHPENQKAWKNSTNESYNEFRDYYRKQTERSFIEEESKKVFVIINSFGGSVGNGITVHDALQFIKAGSLTLGLGVAASASSLVLAGGTIGERYVTEGCHTMIHQPECLSSDHMVLTDKGWLPIENVTLEHKVATLQDHKYLEYLHPTKIHQYEHTGPMYLIKNQSIDLLTTLNHRMYVAQTAMDRPEYVDGKPNFRFGFLEAGKMLHKKVRYKRTAVWNVAPYQCVLPAVEHFTGGSTKPIRTIPEKPLPMEPWLKLFGMWIAEGWTTPISKDNLGQGQNQKYTISLSQKKEDGIEYIKTQIEALNYHFNEKFTIESVQKNTSGSTTIYINNKQLHAYLSPYSVGSLNKSLPDWVWKLNTQQCRWLLEGLIMGDGSININDGTRHYHTGSYQLAHDVSRLALHAEYSATMGLEDNPSRLNTTRQIQGRDIKSTNPMWRVNIIGLKYHPYANDQRKIQDGIVEYSGTVHCLTVPGGVFYVQRNGLPIWTGNSQLQGQASDIWIDSQEIMKIRKDVADIYSLSTYRPKHKILRDLDRDFYMSAAETVAYGLADEIATNEVMHEIVEMTSKVWDVYDSKQQRLLESRESASNSAATATEN